MPTGDTRNVVPRTHENGYVGTIVKQWLKGFFKDFHVARWLTNGSVNVTINEIRDHIDDHPLFVTDFDSAILNGDFLVFDTGLNTWTNKSATELSLSLVGHIHDDRYYTETEVDNLLDAQDELSEMLDVDIGSGVVNGDVLQFQSGYWINAPIVESVITLSTINGQLIPTFTDTNRGNKILSVETTNFRWAEATVSNNDWIQFGHASDADSGFILPHNGTIVRVVGHCENTQGNNKNINLYIDAANNGSIGQFVGAGEQNFVNNALNIDVNSGQKLRMRGDASSGTIRDTAIILWIRWRV